MGSIAKQGAPGPINQGWPTGPMQFPTVTGAFTIRSKVNDAVVTPTFGCPSVFVALNGIGTITSLICQFEVSDNGSDWFTCYGLNAVQSGAGVSQTIATGNFTAVTGLNGYYIPTGGCQFARLRVTTAQTGTGVYQVRLTPFNAPAQIAVNLLSTSSAVPTNTQAIAGFNIAAITQAIQASQVSGVANATTARTTTAGLGLYKSMDYLLNVTGAGVATGVLQIYLQDSVDGGTTWDDVVSFNTFTFGAAVTTQRACVQGAIATTRAGTAAQQTQALAAGTIRQGPFGDRIKVVEVVSGVSGSPTGVTYKIDAIGHL